ncbi:hypothetical protein RRG08_022186 [Elysia crispata]|uniref:Endonuclease/exonuclease/phosphatase domain-containing protein n=1 Tax=Elysia crispata TaxID=231223 RepID=A0AAE1CZL9_9GAST|nr:hypothetical protein RRG08_022186 [Elysia crispata]
MTETELYNATLSGDFNRHSSQWRYPCYNSTGKKTEEIYESTKRSVLQDTNTTTLLLRAHKTLSRLDLTLISPDVLHNHTLDGVGGGDHRTILTMIWAAKEKV